MDANAKTNWLAIALVLGGLLIAKVYVILRPVGWLSVALGTILLIFTEPAEAK